VEPVEKDDYGWGLWLALIVVMAAVPLWAWLAK
jgi:hypothetical protein